MSLRSPEATRDAYVLDDLHRLAERNKQWGRWGPDDELGTLNHVTPELVARAGALIRSGKAFGLAMDFSFDGPLRPRKGSKRFNPVHTMLRSGLDVCCDMSVFREIRAADDMITMPLQCATQWDALSHIFYYDRMWNGYDAKLVTGFGAARNGIEKTRHRMAGRGVLLDMARFLGVPWLPDGYGIGVDELEACAKAQGVTVGRGDFLILRTGQMERCLADGDWGTYAGGDAPGVKAWTADWFRTREIAALATDTWGVEVRPNEVTGVRQPFHWVAIPMIGLTLGEMFDVHELANDCAADGVYEFFFCAPPLPSPGAVGSPINPMAIK
jgi:kynurenine formamidase